jgi:hypothetical protein
MYEITVLHPDALEVLGFFIQLDVFEFSLESERISHLVEEEGDHNVTKAVVGLKACLFSLNNTLIELVTVRQRGCKVST